MLNESATKLQRCCFCNNRNQKLEFDPLLVVWIGTLSHLPIVHLLAGYI